MRIYEPREFGVGLLVVALVVVSFVVGLNDSAREVRSAKAAELKLSPGQPAPMNDARLRAVRGQRFVLCFLPTEVPPSARRVVREWRDDLTKQTKAAGLQLVIIEQFDALAKAYRALPLGLPKLFLIDQRGVIRHVGNGLKRETTDAVVKAAKRLQRPEHGKGGNDGSTRT